MLQQWRDAGIVAADVNSKQARQLEPALNTETQLHSAIHLVNDGVANCRQFALLLKRKAPLRYRLMYHCIKLLNAHKRKQTYEAAMPLVPAGA